MHKSRNHKGMKDGQPLEEDEEMKSDEGQSVEESGEDDEEENEEDVSE